MELTSKVKEYVLGFAFDKTKKHVVLIEKQKPDWQKGSLNGVGGKVETYDENIYAAMAREFKEETGVDTNKEEWSHFASMTFKNDVMGGMAVVYCFRLFSDAVYDCQTMEAEKVSLYSTDINASIYEPYTACQHIKNLKVLIPMAKDNDFYNCMLNVL
jgi:8-oxo-dGTP diphosphatase